MFNSLQDAYQGFQKTIPMLRSAGENIFNKVKSAASSAVAKANPVNQVKSIPSAIQQARQSFAQIPQQASSAIRNAVYDAPFVLANMSYDINNAVRPHVPFDPNDWKTNAEWAAIEAPRPLTIQNMQPDTFAPQVKSPSASFLPIMEAPTSDINNADYLAQQGFRPAAIKYLSRVPVKVGNQYLNNDDSNELGVSYNFNGSKMIGVRQGYQNDPTVLTHEFLHAAPRQIPNSLLIKVTNISPEQQTAYTQRWGQDYMKDPLSMLEEMWAERDLSPGDYNFIFNSPPPQNEWWKPNQSVPPQIMGTSARQKINEISGPRNK